MAKLTFRQGIVSHQTDILDNPTFLNLDSNYVDLVVSPDQTVIAFIHGDSDYLYTEKSTVNNAWGPLPASTDSWIYWDLSLATGELSRSFTILEPLVQLASPTSPVVGQMWYNIANDIWYEWTGFQFVEVVRVFAAKVAVGVTLETMAVATTKFSGSQLTGMSNLNPRARVGSLVYGSNGKALRNTNTNTFFTTEDDFVTGVPTSASNRIGNTILSGRALTNLAAYQVVQYDDFDKITVANPLLAGIRIFGIIEESAVTNETVSFTTEGIIFNEAWDWIAAGANANDPVYIDTSGFLTLDNTLLSVTPVGYVVGRSEVFFTPRMFMSVTVTNGGGSGATAQEAAAIIANTARSQTNQVDIDVLNTNTVPGLQTDIDTRVIRAGDTMTGELVIDSTFIVNSDTNTGIDVTTTNVELEGSALVRMFSDDSIVETTPTAVALSADAGNSTINLGATGVDVTGDILGLTADSQLVTTVNGVAVFTSTGPSLIVGTATGFTSTVLLAVDPTLNLQAATKQYVDNNTVDTAGDTMDSNADITFVGGGEVLGLPAIPSVDDAAASKKYVDDELTSTADLKVDRAGDTMTGNLIVNALLDVNSGTNTGISTTSTNVDIDSATTTTLRVSNAAAITLTNVLATHTKATDFTNTVDVTGATTLLNTLDVTGATELLSTLDVTGATELLSTLDVTGATTLDATLDVIGAADFSSTVDVTGATTLLNTLDVTGATELLSTLDVTGFTTLDSTLDVIGAADFSSTLGVTGATTLLNTLDVTGATELLSTLDVTGFTTLDATLDVIGAVDFSSTLDVTGATTLLSTLNVTGATEFQSTVLLAADPTLALQAATMQYVDNEITAADDLNVNKAGDTMTGDLIINAQLDVNAGTNTGIATTATTVAIDAANNIDLKLAGNAGTHIGMTAGGILMQSADNQSNINITDTTFSVHSNGVLTVRADGSMDLSINGVNAISLTSTLATHTKATDFTSTVDVTGATTLLSTLDVTGAVDFSSTLDVTGATELLSTLDVTGATTLDSTLSVIGATDFSSTVLLAADPTLNLQAATKQYVDNNTVDTAGDTMDSNADITFVGGGEVLGLPAIPSGDTAAASKKYVDDEVTALTGTVNTLTTDDLTDVDTSTTTLATQHTLFWDGTNFVNRYIIKDDVTDFTETDYVHRTNPETVGGEKTFDDDAFFSSDVTITGNLTVNGTETVVNTNNLSVSDNVIVINDGETGSGVALGFAGMRIDRGTATDARFVFNETAGTFKMGIEGSERNVVSTYQAGFVIGDWTAGSPNSLTITAAVHKLPYKVGEVFHVQVYELSGGILSLTTVQTEIVAASGNVTIKTVGSVFAGSIIISK